MVMPARVIRLVDVYDQDRKRFDSKIKFPSKRDGCWEWIGGCFSNGYGSFRFNGQSYTAHRFGYTILVGEVDSNMALDHLCRNKKCVNPMHLEVVTIGENIRRGETGIKNYSKDFCIHGHEFTAENTIVRKTGWRQCRTCHNERRRNRRAV